MPDENVNVNFNINAEVHLHLHSSAQPGAADILNSIQELKETIMTQLDISAAKETADAAALVAAVQALATALEQLRSQNNSALQAALDAANLDAAQQSAILDANDSAVDAALAQANAALNPPQDTQPAGNGDDTVSGGGGTDTTGADSGNDTVDAGGGTDGAPQIFIGVTRFETATVGVPFDEDPHLNGGTAPYSVTSSPPSANGISVGTDGRFTGTPQTTDETNFNLSIADSSSPPLTTTGVVTIAPAPAGTEP